MIKTFKPLLGKHTNYRCPNTQILKFRSSQYMGNHRKKKNLFWPHIYTNPNCTLCPRNDKDTWPHLLSLCENKFLKGLWIARHNIAVHQVTNLLKSSIHTRHFTLTNARTINSTPQGNTIPAWITCCTCNTSNCACLAKLRLNIT